MSQERLSMRKVTEVLRLKWGRGLSNRAITRSCRISHSTVNEYLKRAEAAGIQWPLSNEIEEGEVYQLLFPDKEAEIVRDSKPMPNWEEVHCELQKRAVTLRLLWV